MYETVWICMIDPLCTLRRMKEKITEEHHVIQHRWELLTISETPTLSAQYLLSLQMILETASVLNWLRDSNGTRLTNWTRTHSDLAACDCLMSGHRVGPSCCAAQIASPSSRSSSRHLLYPATLRPESRFWKCVCVDHLKRCKTSNLLDDALQWFSNLTLPFWLFHLIFQQKQGGKAFSDYLAQRSYVTEGEATGDAQLCACR